MSWSDFRLRSRALLFRQTAEVDLHDELAFHIEMQARKNADAGMGLAEANRRARIQFGVGDAAKEECRDERGISFIETLLRDVRYAFRGFARAPGFALGVIGTIALGLGWNTGAFTVFNAYVLRPLAVPDPWSLYQVTWLDRTGQDYGFTWDQYRDLRAAQSAFTQMSAFVPFGTRMDGGFARGILVSDSYFQMLRVPALMGRTLSARDSQDAAVIVLSHAAWQNRFAADPNVIGRKVLLHGHPFEVIGVMPETFSGLDTRFQFDFWTPIAMSSLLMDGPDLFGPVQPGNISVAGRLKAGVTVAHAQSELTAWVQRAIVTPPEAPRAMGASVFPKATSVHGSKMLAAIMLILIPFGAVLLSACANVANMMLARALSRQRETGIRLSLGASRARIIRQMVTEAMLLVLPAAVIGFGLAQAMTSIGTRALLATIPSELVEYIRLPPLAPDIRVFVFVLIAAIASGLVFGLVPAIQATRLDIVQATRGELGAGFRPSRLRNGLVVAQVTVSAMLLIVCGVFIRGANRIRNQETGMRTRDVIEIEVQEKSRAAAIGRLAAAPGVDLVTSAAHAPLDSRLPTALAIREDGGGTVRLPYTYFSSGYLSIFAVPLLRGRNFTAEEARSHAAVAIVSESAARKLWPGRDAVGRSVVVAPDTAKPANRPPSTALVVGVARDTVVNDTDADEGRTTVYYPTDLQAAGSVLLVRVQDAPEAARQRLVTLLEAGDPGAVERTDTMQAFVDARDYPYRVIFWVSATLGGIALLFTLSGIYGVVTWTVAQRTREIGIRVAMGASIRAVVRLVAGQCAQLAVWGIAIGTLLALGAARVLSTQVLLNPFDGVACSGGILGALAACVVAGLLAARRVARIDPGVTLRYD